MDEFHDDPWIQENYPAEIRRLHALGIIQVYWNQCENALFRLFCAVTKLPDDECWALVHDLGDVAVSLRITTLMEIKKFDTAAVGSVTNVLEVYNICRQNRNQLTHYTVVPFVSDFKLMRTSKKPATQRPAQFPNTLHDIRRVVDDIKKLEQRMWFVIAVVESYLVGGGTPWPPILPLPDLLWTPPPQARK